MNNEEKNEAIVNWLNGDLTDRELEAFMAEEVVQSYNNIIQEIDRWEPDKRSRNQGLSDHGSLF